MKKQVSRRILGAVLAGMLLAGAYQLGWLKPLGVIADYTVTPVGSVFGRAGQATGNFMGIIGSIKDLNQENAKLRAEVADLRTRLAEDAEIRAENEILRRQLSFEEVGELRLLPAGVIGYQPDNFRQFLSIRRGSEDGIKEGMAVISEGSLVGRITEVGPRTSKVFLLVDPDFRVNGLDQETRATGTVKGQIGTGLLMDKIAQSDTIKPGDTIVTGGLGGEMPKGIIIGRVEAVEAGDNTVFQTARISSSLKFDKLEVVFIVTGTR